MGRKPVHRFYLQMRVLAGAYLAALLLFFVVRFIYMFRVLEGDEIRAFSGDIFRAFLTAVRFDSVTICYGLVIPVALALVSAPGEKAFMLTLKIQRIYLCILLTLFLSIGIVDYYYYTYFQSHINVQVFGFAEDDTAAVIKSLWTDYPLLRVIAGILIGAFVFFRLVGWMQNRVLADERIFSQGKAYLLSFVLLALFGIGLRSSFGTFPVQIDDASVSSNPKVNLLPVNGVFAFKDAWYYHKNELNLDFVLKDLSENGFPGREEARKIYDEAHGTRDNLYARTDTSTFLRENPPHIVFFLLESWSNYNHNFHSPDLNLLGRLEKYWKQDILFRKFISGHNGTINSIEGLMINTPVTPIAQSEYADITFRSSCAKPFLDKGYATTFISGGKINWRNINNFIPRQYFQHVEGNADIAAHIPGTKECEWGVYDEYLFDDVLDKLNKAASPQFIFALSTTNHTPFHLPDHYKPYPINLPAEMKARIKVDQEMAEKNLANLQYTNDCLGAFLEKLEKSPAAGRTIVVATGDHNNVMLFDFNDTQSLYRYGVPLLMHVPQPYLSRSAVDTTCWGSHKDIFPTIFNLALDDASYFNNGANLLDPVPDAGKLFAINVMGSTAMNGSGAVYYNYRNMYFRREGGETVAPAADPDSSLEALMRISRAYYATMVYHLVDEIHTFRKQQKK